MVVDGPFAAGGALFQSDRFVEQTGPGIEINGVANDTGSATSVLAGGTQANRFGLNSTGSNTNFLAARGTQSNRPSLAFTPGSNTTPDLRNATSSGGSALKSVNNRITTSIKKFSDAVNNVTRELTARPKAGDSTNDE